MHVILLLPGFQICVKTFSMSSEMVLHWCSPFAILESMQHSEVQAFYLFSHAATVFFFQIRTWRCQTWEHLSWSSWPRSHGVMCIRNTTLRRGVRTARVPGQWRVVMHAGEGVPTIRMRWWRCEPHGRGSAMLLLEGAPPSPWHSWGRYAVAGPWSASAPSWPTPRMCSQGTRLHPPELVRHIILLFPLCKSICNFFFCSCTCESFHVQILVKCIKESIWKCYDVCKI
jgi:hypothetical protein